MSYPLTEEGIPVLLNRESEQQLKETEAVFGQTLLAQGWHPPNSRILQRILTPPGATLDLAIEKIAQIFRRYLPPSALVLFIGGMRHRDYRWFSCFRSITLDIVAKPEIDIVGDAHHLPISNEQLDAIVAQAVLEHVLNPDLMLRQLWRVLRRGGLIYVAVPFLQPYHYGPLDYRRFTIVELERTLSLGGFEKIQSGMASGPGSALSWLIRAYLSSFADGAVSRYMLETIGGWLGFLFKYTDLFLVQKRSAELAACAYYYVGRKEG